MAEENKKKPLEGKEKELEELSKKSSASVFGTTGELDDESEDIKNIIRQTMISTSNKYGNRANGKVINYFNELNFSTAFSDLIKNPSEKNKAKEDPNRAFKKYMSEQDMGVAASILMGESSRMVAYNNYRAVYNHIPEAAQALDTFKENIMSPDDFTKLIFNVHYDNPIDKKVQVKIENQLKDLTNKYELESLADEVIEGSLLYGDQYLAVLSLDEELDVMLTDPIMGTNTYFNPGNATFSKLNEENMALYDKDSVDYTINPSDVDTSSSLNEAFSEMFNLKESDKSKVNDDFTKNLVSKMINENVVIGSKKELILERLSAEMSKIEDMKRSGNDLPAEDKKEKNKSKKKKDDGKPLYVNGSSIKLLDPSKVVELKIDNVIYGYYYVQDANVGNIPNAGYLGQSTGREVLNPVTMGSNILTTNNSKFTPSTGDLSIQNVGASKVELISRIFLDVLSKKIDKDFVRHNKEFKDFIYNLIRQDYILKKGVKLIFFNPDEIVAFKVPALYRKIVFFAKLYLAMLTNMLLIKMGRAHDKRVFYVDVGVDANYEQAISRVIQDIKTKEFKMDSMGEINTILNLNPGRFDDYYIPQVNGEKPIEIETLQGMDVDMNNEFLEFLKDSMMSGIGVPRNLIDATKEVDFARTLSAQNANFVRAVIKYQKKLTLPFTRLYRKLYENEFRYVNDGKSEMLSIIDIKDINISFPSPATLNMSNMTDQINSAETNAEFYANTLVVPNQDGSNEREKALLKSEIIKDLLPGIDWEKYEKMKNQLKIEASREKVGSNTSENNMLDDGNMNL
jgi:hypothetical protein